jgi:hypothetical protein
MKRRTPDTPLSALDLIEEGIHALRRTPAATLFCYYVGSAPFVLAVLFFWSDMSRSGLAEKHLVPGAIGLSLLFIWMKVWQAMFARRLAAQLADEPSAPLHAADFARVIASQALIQSTGLFLIPVAVFILLPVQWVISFYQNATALAFHEPSARGLFRRSWKQSCLAAMQGHTTLAVLSLFSLFVFLNVAITLIFAPFMVKTFLGIETTVTLSIESSLNTTFLASAVGVTYLCFDPILKAVYTLRCFYGESRQTGEDLRVALRSFRATAIALVVAFLAFSPLPAPAAAPLPDSQQPTVERASELDRSIDEVLRRPEYSWRAPRAKADAKEHEESAMWKRIQEWVRNTTRAIGDWFDKLFNSSKKSGPSAPGKFSFSAHGLIYILIAAVAVVIGVLVWLLWRTRSSSTQAELEATPAAPVPDLAADDVAGDELPVDGWTRLALELLERGELRLAMRAFYLSSLAHLAERDLVSIARFKSNRDYERELLRRSHALPDLTQTFSQNVSVFDRVWYGMHDINAELLQQFRGNVERIREC